MLYAAAVMLPCIPPPFPEMSLQCAVSAINKQGYEFKPYKGDVENGCDGAVADYRKAFWPVFKNDLSCEYETRDYADCLGKEFQKENFDVFYILIRIATHLLINDETWDHDWFEQYNDIYATHRKILLSAYDTCKVPWRSLFDSERI